MSYHTKDLLTLLISLFVLGGCTNPSGIGLDVDPEDEIVGMLTDTLTLRGATVRDDSTRSVSSASTYTAFGLFLDPSIGETRADLALSLGRPGTVPRIRPDAEIDSVILVLPYGQTGSEYFGDTTASTFALQVRQLDEIYVDGTYATKDWAVGDEVIGSKSISRFAYKRTDSISVRRHIDGKDSLVKEMPQLRISLSADFFKELFAESVDSASLSTAVGFRDHVKGLYLSVDDGASAGIGGLTGFSGIPSVSGIHLTFRQPNGKTGEDAGTDTIRTFFPTTISDQNTGTSVYGLATSVKRTYTDAIEAQLDAAEDNYDKLYVQAPSGLRARLRIPHIDSLKGRDIAVNKAELVLYVNGVPADGFNTHAPRLTLYREDIAGQRQPIPDGDSRSSGQNFSGDGRSLWYRYGHWRAFGGNRVADGNGRQRYVFHLTSYIQDLLMGKINSAEFFIAPASENDSTVPYFPVLNTGGRAIIGNTDNPDVRIKLNIYYTQTVTN